VPPSHISALAALTELARGPAAGGGPGRGPEAGGGLLSPPFCIHTPLSSPLDVAVGLCGRYHRRDCNCDLPSCSLRNPWFPQTRVSGSGGWFPVCANPTHGSTEPHGPRPRGTERTCLGEGMARGPFPPSHTDPPLRGPGGRTWGTTPSTPPPPAACWTPSPSPPPSAPSSSRPAPPPPPDALSSPPDPPPSLAPGGGCPRATPSVRPDGGGRPSSGPTPPVGRPGLPPGPPSWSLPPHLVSGVPDSPFKFKFPPIAGCWL